MDLSHFQRHILIKYRTEKGLSQDELSRVLQIPQYIISRLETGITKSPRIFTIYKIALFFKVPIETFLGEASYSKSKRKANV